MSNFLLVLVPGFEPGSTDRESVMMDRTTLHEPYHSVNHFIFENVVFPIFTFTFTHQLPGPPAAGQVPSEEGNADELTMKLYLGIGHNRTTRKWKSQENPEG